jgi:SHS2 domain-containing protein
VVVTVPNFTTIEHTADVGIEAEGDSLSEVFANAACGMVSFMCETAAVAQRVTRETALEADDLEELMFVWLNEILYLIDAEGLLFSSFEVEVEGTRLHAVLRGEPMDPDKHELKRDIKATTYHQLSVRRVGGGGRWKAHVIFDV